MVKDFLVEYIDDLKKYCLVPRSHNESAFSPILRLYLENIVNSHSKIKENEEKYELITVELPIFGKYIDYLLIDRIKKIALLVELKTEHKISSNSKKQMEIYEKIIDNKKRLKELVPTTFQKIPIPWKSPSFTQRQNNKQRELINYNLVDIKKIKIMYIAPEYFMKQIIDKKFIDYKIGFEELKKLYFDKKTEKYIDPIWEKICEYISELD
jgi:hypothetical protein